MKSVRTIAAVSMLVAALPAAAQDFDADPNYGAIALRSGFTPDPHRINLRAGGNLSAQSISGSCRGSITNAPDVRLTFSAGSLPLIISVNSGVDTTLVVNGPDGQWHCNDDANGVNPVLRFNNPQSGRYEIWVGTYSSGATQPATLSISEIN